MGFSAATEEVQQKLNQLPTKATSSTYSGFKKVAITSSQICVDKPNIAMEIQLFLAE